MLFDALPPNRRFFVPEVVQTSAMDCGPATLKALLEGFDISVSYGRLREACQTSVDGTSIDVLEEVAVQLGLAAEQIMIPTDHLLVAEAEALPAIVVVRQPNGLTHFVVAWSQHGPLVQVMDPAIGRRWLTQRRFLEELYLHAFPVPAGAWREWAGSEGFCAPLRQRLANLGLEEPDLARLIDPALADPTWRSLAALDAATRLVASLVGARGLERGAEARGVLDRFLATALARPAADTAKGEAGALIPARYWSVQPVEADSPDEEEQLLLRGAVLVRVTGRRAAAPLPEALEQPPAPLSPELVAALAEAPSRPELEILRFLRADGLLTPSVLLVALGLAAGAVLVEAMLLRGILDIGRNLILTWQRVGSLVALLIFLIVLLLLELPIAATVLRFGRRLESRLRVAFFEKIPRLSDRYFHSRLTSDMTQRAHDLRRLRLLPNLGVTFLRLSFQIGLTGLGVIWLDPTSAPLAILATIFAVGLSFASQPVLAERDLRLRTHVGALSRFYLDALLGLVPLRAHSAERAVRREHENLLVEWIRAGLEFYRLETMIHLVEALIGSGFAVWILFNYIASGGEASGILLLFYWALNLPVLGQMLADTAMQYPLERNKVLRLLEPLGAPDETGGQAGPAPGPTLEDEAAGVAITMEKVTVQAGGQTILSDINLAIAPGEHIAVVGPSGAGKSSLVGLLLGWHRPAAGRVLVEGALLAGPRLEQLRRQTAWIDPEVQLWNRSLLENLRYGSQNSDAAGLSETLEQADLFAVLEKLPNGLQTLLGESGGLVSGGEGQRVRLGRGMFRAGVRLVILDEPFRGLDRTQRRELLARARRYWSQATLICVTHDVSETLAFERVLVIENGQIIEDATPAALTARTDSRYQALLAAEEAVRQGLWGSTGWRRLWLENGQLQESQVS
jgi:ABC-type bacteriocin/lantibiotic exporter with double-glycine peptidase domain